MVVKFQGKNFINSQCKFLQNVRIEGLLKDYIYQTEFEKGLVYVLKKFTAIFTSIVLVFIMIFDPTNMDKYIWSLFEPAIIMMQKVRLDPLTKQIRRNVTYRFLAFDFLDQIPRLPALNIPDLYDVDCGLCGVFIYNMAIPTLIILMTLAVVLVLRLQVIGHKFDLKPGKLSTLFVKLQSFMDLSGMYFIFRALLPLFLLNP